MRALPLYLFLLFAVTIATPALFAQSGEPDSEPKRQPLLVDEFAGLDDEARRPSITDERVVRRIELARKHYLKGMSLVAAGKRSEAIRYFDGSMSILNDLLTHPEIDAFPEYTLLSRSVLRDYEQTVTSVDDIEDLDSSSSFFVLRDKMYQEIEMLPVTYRPAEADGPEILLVDTLRIELTDHEAVAQTLDYFTNGRGRKYMAKWLARSGRFFPMYERILAEEGAPDELKYLSMIESGLNPTVTSHAHAVGLWQFIASTGRAYGMHADWYKDERRDPEKATRAAARYLLDLYDEMGDWHLALGSYNCGPGRMRRALRRADSTDYWSARDHLPSETRRYVPLYIAAAKIARDPAAYGFTDIELESPDRYEVIPVYSPHAFSTLADVGGFSVDELRRLNPELLRDQVPPGETVYDLRVPVGFASLLNNKLDSIALESPAVSVVRHKVVRGETVTKIARKYGVSVSDVLSANNMTAKSILRRGATLTIQIAGNAGADRRIAERFGSKGGTDEATTTDTGVESADVSAATPAPTGSTVESPSARTARAFDAKTDGTIPEVEAMIAVAPTAERKSMQVGLDNVAPARSSSEQTILQVDARIASPVAPTQFLPESIASESFEEVSDFSIGTESTRRTTISFSNRQASPRSFAPYTAQQTESKTVAPVENREELASESDVANHAGAVDSSVDPDAFARTDIRPSEATTGPAIAVTRNRPASAAAVSNPVGVRRYKVRRGETIGDIAARFDVSVVELQRYNPRLDPSRIRAGQVIRVR